MDLDSRAACAAKDEKVKNEFIAEYKNFILASASRTLKRSITDSDDEFMTAMIAFNDAIDGFDASRGSFLSFAAVVIRRRLIDELRRNSGYEETVFSALEREDGSPFEIPVYNDNSIKWEIEALTAELKEYGISFLELAEVSPKSRKTKKVCFEAARYICGGGELLSELLVKHRLPIKELTDNAGLNRKTVERHRKYIIAAIIITVGDYPGIAEYLNIKGV